MHCSRNVKASCGDHIVVSGYHKHADKALKDPLHSLSFPLSCPVMNTCYATGDPLKPQTHVLSYHRAPRDSLRCNSNFCNSSNISSNIKAQVKSLTWRHAEGEGRIESRAPLPQVLRPVNHTWTAARDGMALNVRPTDSEQKTAPLSPDNIFGG